MRYILLLFIFCIFLPTLKSQTYNVLFIGNSYTYTNDLPGMLRDLALSNGDTVHYDSYAPGGYTFELHSSNPTTIAKIKEKNWDFVILQEQSQRPSFPPQQVAAEVYPYAAILDSIIKSNNPCTETVFFMTWGRKYGDQVNCQYYPPVCTFQGMQQRLRESYLEMGNTLSATVAPVGIAWKTSIEADSNINLFMSDNSHPGNMGTYLAACTFYATLYGKSPAGLPFISNLSQTTAGFLQNIAAITVLDSFAVWNINSNLPVADFTYMVINNTVSFSDNSINATSYYWDFGDGTSDTVPNPVHNYLSPGSYYVSLEVNSECATDNRTDTLEIISAGLTDNDNFDDISVSFDAGLRYMSLCFSRSIKNDFIIQIIDINGNMIFQSLQNGINSDDILSFDVSQIRTGIYFIRLTGENTNTTYKFILPR